MAGGGEIRIAQQPIALVDVVEECVALRALCPFAVEQPREIHPCLFRREIVQNRIRDHTMPVVVRVDAVLGIRECGILFPLERE